MFPFVICYTFDQEDIDRVVFSTYSRTYAKWDALKKYQQLKLDVFVAIVSEIWELTI